jgi:hypothetical protein
MEALLQSFKDKGWTEEQFTDFVCAFVEGKKNKACKQVCHNIVRKLKNREYVDIEKVITKSNFGIWFDDMYPMLFDLLEQETIEVIKDKKLLAHYKEELE